jgi:hypothetical protein
MKPMKLAEVRKHTGRALTYAEAVKLANPVDPFLRNMAVALSLHSWNNTPQDWLRLEAALVILHHKARRAHGEQECRGTLRNVAGSPDPNDLCGNCQ